jgi:hypothetical protein
MQRQQARCKLFTNLQFEAAALEKGFGAEFVLCRTANPKP